MTRIAQLKVCAVWLALWAAAVLLVREDVRATNHENHIREILAGANGDSRVQFIVIEQKQSGQNLWGPQPGETESRAMLVFYDGSGRETGKFKFPASPATGGSLQTLIATQEFAALPGAPAPDIIIHPLLVAISGKVCFKHNPANPEAVTRNECVSYGSFSGDTEINVSGSGPGVAAGPPAPALPLVDTVSLRRSADTGRNSDFQLTTTPTAMNIAGGTFNIPVEPIVDQGKNLFMLETFRGNGRTCATCHVASLSLGLSPGHVQSQFASLGSPTFSFDPLFVAERTPSGFDAGFDFNLNTLVLTAAVATGSPCTGELRGRLTAANNSRAKVLARISATTYLVYGGLNPALTGTVSDGTCAATVLSISAGDLAAPVGSSVLGLEQPARMRRSVTTGFSQGRALILENIDGFTNPPVFRKSPHLLNVSRTGPFGFSGDIQDLQSFTTGAVLQHFPRTLARSSSGAAPDFRLPTSEELAAMDAFMRAQEFPAGDDPNKFDLDRFVTTEAQRAAREDFFGDGPSDRTPRCAFCHGGTTLSHTTVSILGKPVGVNASFNTGGVNSGAADGLPCEPGVGVCGSREFSTPQLFNLKRLAPFFHNASLPDISGAVLFYNTSIFNDSPAGQALNTQLGLLVDAFLEALVQRPYTLTTGPVRFASQSINAGQTAVRTITITNPTLSAVPFFASGCRLTGRDASQFVITSCPLAPSLAPGQSKTVQVAFDPSSHGLKTATLEIIADDESGIDLFGVGGPLGQPPTISTVSPTSGTRDGGDTVTVTGTNFIQGATVVIGGVAAGFVRIVNPTAIVARTGAHAAGPADVQVVNPDGQTAMVVSGFAYTSAQALTIGSIAPASGSVLGGTVVTIAGDGFKDGAAVSIGGRPASNVLVLTSKTIRATTGPQGAGLGGVAVTNPGGQTASLANSYTYVSASAPPVPTVASISPARGSMFGGTLATITGTGFLSGAGVFIGGAAATGVVVVNSTTITARTAARASGRVNVTVMNPDGKRNLPLPGFFGVKYDYTPPNDDFANRQVLIGAGSFAVSGTLGGAAPEAGEPAGDGDSSIWWTWVAPCSFTVAAPARFIEVTPSTSVTHLTVFTGSILPALSTFASESQNLSTHVPTSGSLDIVAGTVFQIRVRDFSSSNGGNGKVSVIVHNPCEGWPIITGLAPAAGPAAGGTQVTISGAGFAPGATVTFGGVPAGVASVTATAITVVTPARPPGPVAVVVTNPDAQVAAVDGAFNFVPSPPAPIAIVPALGPITGGTTVVISGNAFLPGATVTMGGATASVGSVTATTIVATTAKRAAGVVDVVVTNPDGQSGTLPGAFAYRAPPAVASVSPPTILTAGGTVVTIVGSGFLPGLTVTLGTAANVQNITPTTVTAVAPPHAAGVVDVRVTNTDGQSGTLAGGLKFAFARFTDEPLVAGTTTVKTVHFTELRSAINALRVRFGLGPFNWTTTALTGAVVTTADVQEMRTALRDAYAAAIKAGLNVTLPSFTDDPLMPGVSVIRVSHIEQLRAAVLGLEAR